MTYTCNTKDQKQPRGLCRLPSWFWESAHSRESSQVGDTARLKLIHLVRAPSPFLNAVRTLNGCEPALKSGHRAG